MKGENTMLAVLGATVVGALALLFRQVHLAARGGPTETPVEGLSPDEVQNLESRLSEALSDPTRVKTVETSLWQRLDPSPKVVVLPPWRFQRLAGIPAPHVVDARRLEKLPAADIRHALHRGQAGTSLRALDALAALVSWQGAVCAFSGLTEGGAGDDGMPGRLHRRAPVRSIRLLSVRCPQRRPQGSA